MSAAALVFRPGCSGGDNCGVGSFERSTPLRAAGNVVHILHYGFRRGHANSGTLGDSLRGHRGNPPGQRGGDQWVHGLEPARLEGGVCAKDPWGRLGQQIMGLASARWSCGQSWGVSNGFVIFC